MLLRINSLLFILLLCTSAFGQKYVFRLGNASHFTEKKYPQYYLRSHFNPAVQFVVESKQYYSVCNSPENFSFMYAFGIHGLTIAHVYKPKHDKEITRDIFNVDFTNTIGLQYNLCHFNVFYNITTHALFSVRTETVLITRTPGSTFRATSKLFADKNRDQNFFFTQSIGISKQLNSRLTLFALYTHSNKAYKSGTYDAIEDGVYVVPKDSKTSVSLGHIQYGVQINLKKRKPKISEVNFD